MKHNEIIQIYNDFIEKKEKLNRVVFVRRLGDLGNSVENEIRFGLKEAKDLVDDSSNGEELLKNMKVKYPCHYKMLNFVKKEKCL